MRMAGAALLAVLVACVSAPEPAPVGAPVVALEPGLPAPPQAQLYADCIGQAAQTGSFQREPDGGTLRFICTGETAKWFYDALEVWSTQAGAVYVEAGRTWRFSKKLIEDSSGVDGCSRDGAGDYQCVVILAVGAFIEQPDYRVPPR